MEEKIGAGYSTQKLPDGPTSQSMYGRCYRCGDMGPYEYGIIYVRMCIDDVWKSVPVCARCWNKYHASDGSYWWVAVIVIVGVVVIVMMGGEW